MPKIQAAEFLLKICLNVWVKFEINLRDFSVDFKKASQENEFCKLASARTVCVCFMNSLIKRPSHKAERAAWW